MFKEEETITSLIENNPINFGAIDKPTSIFCNLNKENTQQSKTFNLEVN